MKTNPSNLGKFRSIGENFPKNHHQLFKLLANDQASGSITRKTWCIQSKIGNGNESIFLRKVFQYRVFHSNTFIFFEHPKKNMGFTVKFHRTCIHFCSVYRTMGFTMVKFSRWSVHVSFHPGVARSQGGQMFVQRQPGPGRLGSGLQGKPWGM